MPLRSRLSKTGLKLKIPARTVASSASPYGPSRHSASPIRRRDGSNSRKPNWPKDLSPSGQNTSNLQDQRPSKIVKSNDLSSFSQTVTSFDAAIDSRPVWAVKEEKYRPSTEGFRDIPIKRSTGASVIGLFGNDNVCTNDDSDSSFRTKSSFHNLETKVLDADEQLCSNYHFVDGSPESPILDLAPSPDFFTNRSPLVNDLQRINQRAEHLRDWFYNLNPNPRERNDITYSHSYLSSPVPTFRSRSDISPSRY